MRSKTRVERAKIAFEILKEHEGISMSLGEWLDLLNKKLKYRYAIRSTKELAFMFRYMSKIMHLKLIKTKQPVTLMEDIKGMNTFYTYTGGDIHG